MPENTDTLKIMAQQSIVTGVQAVTQTTPIPSMATSPQLRLQIQVPFRFRLPVELLRAIFEEYLRLDLPFRVLLQVNHQWRAVALGTASLWRQLLISAHAIPTLLQARPVHAYDLKLQMIPASNQLTSITTFDPNSILDPIESRTFTAEQRTTPFKTVAYTNLHTFETLCLSLTSEVAVDLVTQSLDGALITRLLNLESLMITSTNAVCNSNKPLIDLIGVVDIASTKLQYLYLENLNQDFIIQASTKAFWKRFIRVTIRSQLYPLNAEFFSQSPNLESLSFSDELVAAPGPRFAHLDHLDSSMRDLIDFPELKWLHIGTISMGTLTRLKMPKLHTMVIDCVKGAYPLPYPPPGQLLIPVLKVLQIATVNPTIACINAPELDTLCLYIPALKKSDADHILRSVFHGGQGMMKPKHLTLRAPVNDKHLLAVLRILGEKLTSLNLDSQMVLNKMFWMEMTPRHTRQGSGSLGSGITSPADGGIRKRNEPRSNPAATGSWKEGEQKFKPLLLPNLKSLIVDVHKNPMAQEGGHEMKDLLMRLIEGRKTSTVHENLLRLACRWGDGASTEEMIDPPICLDYKSEARPSA